MPQSRSLLKSLLPNIRRLHDQAIIASGKLRAYNDITLRRYSVKENNYKDETKTLIEVINHVSIYIDFPNDVSTTNMNSPFVEDVLPITALIPWKHGCKDLKIDIGDEIDVYMEDEFGHQFLHTYSIIDRQTMWEQYLVFREFIIAPKRVDAVDVVGNGGLDEPTGGDPNTVLGRTPTVDILSQYDN